MVTEKNNMHDVDTSMFFKWVFKAFVAVYLVTHTFDITMAVFDMAQHVVSGAAGVIGGSTEIDVAAALASMQSGLDAIRALFPIVLTARPLRDFTPISTRISQSPSAPADSRCPAERNTLHGQQKARGAIQREKYEMIHGYARCSTNESKQDIDRQVRELKQAGAENIFLEYEHGDAVVKCQLSSLLEQAQAGDTIITLEVSRLARSTKQLCEIIEAIRAKRLRLVIVGSITVDCSNGEIDPMTNAFIQMSGVFAELELRIIRTRVKSGMANAKAKGARIGRPTLTADDIPPIFLRHYPAYRSKQLNLSELARVCGLSRTTAYKYIDLLEGRTA